MELMIKEPLFYDYEGLPPDPVSVPCGDAKPSSQGTKTITLGTFTLSQIEAAITNIVGHAIQTKGVITTHTRPCLFVCDCYSNHYSYLPDIKVKHNDTWDGFGRAYFESCDYPFTEFHCTLCSVDEIRQKIEAWMLQYERNRIVSDLYLIAEPVPSFWERYLAQRHWNESLYARIESFQTDYRINRKLWTTDDTHSCRPYKGLLNYQHQLVKLSLSRAHLQARAAAQPCCRSFLMASRRQSSGDDLLGH